MKNELICTYDTQVINEAKIDKKNFLKNVEKFFIENSQMQDNEIFYVIKASIDTDGKVQSHCTYYGTIRSPIYFLVDSKKYSNKVLLTRAKSKEAMLEFIYESKQDKKDENIYAVKVLYEDLKLSKVQSFYGGKYKLDVYMLNNSDKKHVLKRFGRVEYTPRLQFFMSEI
ncbi:MAG: hypothetical protein NTW78_03085 [Campylobacterales bacterium]|nr:hypothetical protein [Campylobacterales bacterium]